MMMMKHYYCPISINSAGPVTHYTPVEILVSALWPGRRYIAQKIRQVTAEGPNLVYKAWDPPKDSAPPQNDRYLRYISGLRYALLPN